MNYLARITPDKREQLLTKHLHNVAEMSASAVPQGFQAVARYAGLWHDLGKYRQKWQEYLINGGKQVFHSPHGAVLALQMAKKEPPAIAYIIAGHHSCLSERLRIKGDEYKQLAAGLEECLENAKQEIADFIPEQLPDINLPKLRREFAIRMLFSVLVDSDRLDAQRFEYKGESPLNLELSAYNKMSFNPHSFSSPSSNVISEARNVFAQHCTNKSELPKGIFRLTGPCGVGKTIASANFAYLHSQKHQMSGIVYVGPLKSIIEQTADVYRQLFGETAVLEHHSGYEPKIAEVKEYKLNTERWDKPVIVTSGVQFYESLFAHTPTKCRKLQGLINKVILLDESQSIPAHLVRPILNILNTLVTDWGCTVVLMSATQPAFHNLDDDDLIDAVDIIPENETIRLFQQLNRVHYQYIADIWEWENIVSSIQESGLNQGLIIVNTTKLAREGYQILSEKFPDNFFHLSSRMCPGHRSQILGKVRQLLKDQKPCFLISTQVVESGVDVDFPIVYRQLAPLDSIIQAAGRCNREGKQNKGNVIIFNMLGTNPPGYIYPTNLTQTILVKYDLNGDILRMIEMYFSNLFNQNHDGGIDIQRLRESYDFPEVAKSVKVIDDEHQISVVVKWGDSEKLIAQMQTQEYLTELDWRKLQQFTVNLPKKFTNYIQIGKIDVWTGDYDQKTGIME
ncbi:CRISPR-associated helicase Cas3' [Dolichospermum sp. ST_con]|nr:CRISPR-associated helicase Cas3' [Dolichospermum sp. ST_con]MDD1419100.1 CRISPR-associated helicase Cas3' [Dolichospermum sp. ST_sed1]MDD1426144.1 CRISPR-associated helicase Cas3' [Dolichospermum sp. ST_sed9]MDD1430749.1 CRISPR-associated helicase Cas3' [Dolichospermum sp. ST_sed6]MDD1435614.1 CRISPR-associated helicase Cas3' [Dolichospermum sp. ST_sed10]MDD1440675.1 CRISPR-associated helicase Cas3' [Dolichospermum sp. ST_sed3]MDD1446793.1 CRISPR-associated helicase Cas3' [Dolichospermum s